MMNPWVVKWSADGVERPEYDAITLNGAHDYARSWAESATGNVALVRTNFAEAGILYVVPAVGQKCAINVGSDRDQYEVCDVRPNGKTILIKRGEITLQARKQTDGFFKLWGGVYKGYVIFTNTDDYREPSF